MKEPLSQAELIELVKTKLLELGVKFVDDVKLPGQHLYLLNPISKKQTLSGYFNLMPNEPQTFGMVQLMMPLLGQSIKWVHYGEACSNPGNTLDKLISELDKTIELNRSSFHHQAVFDDTEIHTMLLPDSNPRIYIKHADEDTYQKFYLLMDNLQPSLDYSKGGSFRINTIDSTLEISVASNLSEDDELTSMVEITIANFGIFNYDSADGIMDFHTPDGQVMGKRSSTIDRTNPKKPKLDLVEFSKFFIAMYDKHSNNTDK